MQTDQNGIRLITKVESCSLTAYPDAGKYSIGYGHRGSDVYAGMKITAAQAKEYLRQDLAEAESCINRNFAGISLTQNEFNAMVSMAYNRGCTGFVTSDVGKLIKAGKKTEAAQVWLSSGVTPKGSDKVSDHLVYRRAQEAAMFAGKPVTSSQAAMLTEENNPSTLMAIDPGSFDWKTLGWLGFIGASIWAGNKWGIPAWKKAFK